MCPANQMESICRAPPWNRLGSVLFGPQRTLPWTTNRVGWLSENATATLWKKDVCSLAPSLLDGLASPSAHNRQIRVTLNVSRTAAELRSLPPLIDWRVGMRRVSILILGQSYGARNALSYTRYMIRVRHSNWGWRFLVTQVAFS